jgi:hypothetical protein
LAGRASRKHYICRLTSHRDRKNEEACSPILTYRAIGVGWQRMTVGESKGL